MKNFLKGWKTWPVVAKVVGAVVVVATVVAVVVVFVTVAPAVAGAIALGAGVVVNFIDGLFTDPSQEKIDSFNRMDQATLQAQSVGSLLEVVKGKPIIDWLDTAHKQMLSDNQRNGVQLGLEALRFTNDLNEFQVFLKQALNHAEFLKFTGVEISIQKAASYLWSGQSVIDGNKFIALYEKYRAQIENVAIDFPVLAATYENILNRSNMVGSATGLAKLQNSTQSMISWLGNTHNAMQQFAPVAGAATDVTTYCQNIANQLSNQMGQFQIVKDALSEIEFQHQTLVKNGLSDELVRWALDGASQSAEFSGGITYTSNQHLTMQAATTKALTDLFNDADSFVVNANQGIAQVVENKRVAEVKSLITQIFDVVSSVVSLGVGFGKTFVAAGDKAVKLALETSGTIGNAFAVAKNQVNNWLKPSGDGQYKGGFMASAYSDINKDLNDLSSGFSPDAGLSAAMNKFSADYKTLIKTLDDKLWHSKTLLINDSRYELTEDNYSYYKSEYAFVSVERDTYSYTDWSGWIPDVVVVDVWDLYGYNPN